MGHMAMADYLLYQKHKQLYSVLFCNLNMSLLFEYRDHVPLVCSIHIYARYFRHLMIELGWC